MCGQLESGRDVRLVVEGLGELFVLPWIFDCVESSTPQCQHLSSPYQSFEIYVPFFLWCHGVDSVFNEEMVVPSTCSNGKDSGSGAGGIEGSGRRGSF